jgi:anti-sigma regulatory factor (Ser/Thr protein kinase)
MSYELRYVLPHDASAPAAARQALGALSGTLADGALAELQLLVSELVTNAVRHGRARDGGTVELSVVLARKKARISVVDGGNGFVPPGPPSDPAQPGGWGLVVVDRLARRWGVEHEPCTSVWMEVDVDRPVMAAPGHLHTALTMAAPFPNV